MISWISSYFNQADPCDEHKHAIGLKEMPNDVIYTIFLHLSLADMSKVSGACRRFRIIAKSDYMPPRLRFPKIRPETVQLNANNLWRYPDTTWNIADDSTLQALQWYHFSFSNTPEKRVIIQKKVCDVVAETLMEIYYMNSGRSIKPQKNGNPRHIYVWRKDTYSFSHPAYDLAHLLLHPVLGANQFKDHPGIMAAARLLIEQKEIYQDLVESTTPCKKIARDCILPIRQAIFERE